MSKTDMFMWNLPVKNTFFFFLHHVGEGQTKHVYGPDGCTNLQPLHLTLPVILIVYSLPTPSPTNQNLTPIGRTFLLGSRSHELICRVLMGPFCLLLSFSFLCSWKTQICWHHPTPSQRPYPLLLTPDHEAFRPLRRRGAATDLWLER